MRKIIIYILLFFFLKEGYSQKISIEKIIASIGVENRNYSTRSLIYDTVISYHARCYELKASVSYASILESGIVKTAFGGGHNLLFEQKIQLIPLITKKNESRLKLYIPCSYSLLYFAPNKTIKNKHTFQHDGFRYGIGGSYNFNKKWGIYGEHYIHKSKYSSYKPYSQLGFSYAWNTTKDKTINTVLH